MISVIARPLDTTIAARGNAAKIDANDETAAVAVKRADLTSGASPSSAPTGTIDFVGSESEAD